MSIPGRKGRSHFDEARFKRQEAPSPEFRQLACWTLPCCCEIVEGFGCPLGLPARTIRPARSESTEACLRSRWCDVGVANWPVGTRPPPPPPRPNLPTYISLPASPPSSPEQCRYSLAPAARPRAAGRGRRLRPCNGWLRHVRRTQLVVKVLVSAAIIRPGSGSYRVHQQ